MAKECTEANTEERQGEKTGLEMEVDHAGRGALVHFAETETSITKKHDPQTRLSSVIRRRVVEPRAVLVPSQIWQMAAATGRNT